jgi:exopolysaccharide biosynthesis polyprenyl glycosylphosphotransferase
MSSHAQSIMRVVRTVDTLCLASVAAWIWGSTPFSSRLNLLALLILVPFNAGLLEYAGLYESHRVEGLAEMVRNFLSAQIAAISLCALFLPFGLYKHFGGVALFFLLGSLLIMLERSCSYSLLRFLRSHGFDLRRACVIGTRAQAEEMDRRFSRTPAWGLKVFYWGEKKDSPTERFYDFLSGQLLRPDLKDLLHHEAVDELLIFSRPDEIDAHRVFLALSRQYGVTARLVLVPDARGETVAEPQYEDFLGGPSLAVHSTPFATAALATKRMIDILVSMVLIALLLPVALVVACLVKLSSSGPIFYRQRRVGRRGRHFMMYKFRSMVENAEGLLSRVAARNITEGPAFKSRDDWRVTTVGRYLRRYSLDELPQLFNVLRGEMSLVGPRPLPVHEALDVPEAHRRRFTMRPGLTCFWQVSGRSEIPFASWMRMDVEYIDGWSLWLDTKLLVRTIPAVFAGRGAF